MQIYFHITWCRVSRHHPPSVAFRYTWGVTFRYSLFNNGIRRSVAPVKIPSYIRSCYKVCRAAF